MTRANAGRLRKHGSIQQSRDGEGSGSGPNGMELGWLEDLLASDDPRLEQLFQVVRANGEVSSDDIVTVFPEVDESAIRADLVSLALQHIAEGMDEAEPDDISSTASIPSALTNRLAQGSPNDEPVLAAVDAGDNVGLYLREVGRVPLLTQEEEVWLAKRMEKMVNARAHLARRRRMSALRRRELQALVEDGMAAREHLVIANSRLVISVAKKYVGRGVPFLDLVQEGNIGLMRAVKKFDYRRGLKFSTYATWWIRQAVTRAIANQSRTIRVPVHMGDQINKMLRVSHMLTQQLGRDPTPEELAVKLDVTPGKIDDMIKAARRPLSLDMPVGDEEDTTLGTFIEDAESPAPAEMVTENLLRQQIQTLLADLPPREVRILQLRYGLQGGRSHTLKEVAQKLGVSRERVRQIEAQALGRLRHHFHLRSLRDYLFEL